MRSGICGTSGGASWPQPESQEDIACRDRRKAQGVKVEGLGVGALGVRAGRLGFVEFGKLLKRLVCWTSGLQA